MHKLGKSAQLLRHLDRKLSGRQQHNSLQLLNLRIYPLKQREPERSCLSRTGLSLANDISAF